MIEVEIKRPPPAHGKWIIVTACLRRPKLAASEAAVRRMLASVEFGK